ncbi:hypothetical protein [Candidatus Tisiphia endosymbiont of Stenodema calcarata]|uniref:hypothetical protein n=1 Tax=Candidatus Tisiphia endosymbiont of Stenodema calcarata TaxID=3139337 RepID=UPI003CCB246F
MLRPPFDMFTKCTEIEEWLSLVDDFRTKSDIRIVINQSLSYICIDVNLIIFGRILPE